MKGSLLLLFISISMLSFGQIEDPIFLDIPFDTNIIGVNVGAYVEAKCGTLYYSDSGKLRSKGDCLNDTLHGKFTRWNSSGMKTLEESYEFGVLKKRVQWYLNGNIETVEHFHDRAHLYKRVSKSVEGNLLRVHHFDWQGREHGEQYDYNSSGELNSMLTYVHGEQEGKQKFCYPNKGMVEIYHLKNGQRNGEYQKWEHDVLIERGNFRNNQKNGEWVYYDSKDRTSYKQVMYEDGLIHTEATYFSNQLVSSMNKQTGAYLEFDTNGIKRKEWSFVGGNRAGLQKEWDENGRLVAKYHSVNDKYCDSAIFYNLDGTYRVLNWIPYALAKDGYRNHVTAYCEEYVFNSAGDTLEQRIVLNSIKNYEVVTVNPYLNNQRSGKWKLVRMNKGNINKEVTYVNGKLEGPFHYFQADNSEEQKSKSEKQEKALHIRGTYSNNQLDGERRMYYETDSGEVLIELAHYANGLLEGQKIDYINGRPHIFWNYHQDTLDGAYRMVWPVSKVPIEVGTFVNGKKHGHWVHSSDSLMLQNGYNYRGRAYSGYYNMGVKVGHWKHFGQYGHLESEGEYVNGEPNGHWIIYYLKDSESTNQEPTKYMEGTLLNDQKVGVWIQYDEEGKRLKKIDFDEQPFLNDLY